MRATHQLLGLTVVGFFLFLGCSQTSFVRSISMPLAVKSPYLAIWDEFGFYESKIDKFLKFDDYSLILLARVNNETYKLGLDDSIQLTQRDFTPTQSIYNSTAGPVKITTNFFTPMEINDLRRLSLPVSYIAVSAQSNDNQTYPVQVFVGWQARRSTGNPDATIRWNSQQLGPVLDLYMERVNQTPLYEYQNRAHWGTFHVFTNSVGTTFGIDKIDHLISNFTNEGRLYNTMDQNFRPYMDNNLTMGFVKEIIAGPSPSPDVFLGMARVARPAINTTEGPMNHLWEDFFNGDEKEMIKFALEDSEGALARAKVFDAKILEVAEQVDGVDYRELVLLTSRIVFYEIELVGTQNRTWAFIKDIGMNSKGTGSCQSVDLIYANMPAHLYLNPQILKFLLEPLLVYQESGHFAKQWAASDLGAAYPQCTGGHDRAMGVEQSANMLIMIDAYVRASNDTDFARLYYNISRKWAEYLVTNGLYPGEASTSDDHLGKTVNSTNLSLKAIIAIAAMADIAQRVNTTADYSHYRSVAENYTAQWISLSRAPGQKHIKSSFNDHTSNSWVLLYNLYADILLETNLIPNDIIKQQQLLYSTKFTTYGIPLRNGINKSKTSWLLFTAAASPPINTRRSIYEVMKYIWSYKFLKTYLGDMFTTSDSRSQALFIDRLTIGAAFAPLTTLARKSNFSVDN